MTMMMIIVIMSCQLRSLVNDYTDQHKSGCLAKTLKMQLGLDDDEGDGVFDDDDDDDDNDDDDDDW